MPLVKITLAPGLVKDDTPLAAEGGWIDADKVRFVQGRPQVIGGWQMASADNFAGIARGAHAWSDLLGRRHLAWGTAANLYTMAGGAIRDITPPHSEGVLFSPFTTVSGSAIVTVAHPQHGFVTGQSVTFANQSISVAGLLLDSTYVVSVIDADIYSIISGSPAGASATGGGFVDFSAVLPVGLIDGTGEPGGFGSGSYGGGGYGETDATDSNPRIWFLDNWGETLVALPRGGALYQYQPALAYNELVQNVDFSSPSGWTVGAGWTIAAGVASAVAGASSSLTTPVAVTPGYVYRVQASVTVAAGVILIRADSAGLDAASSNISVSGTYSRLFRAPVGMTTLRIDKDASFVGTIDNVSVTLESVAFRVAEAPVKSAAMFLDPHQIVVLAGTILDDGIYRPMAIRWSDRQDITAWTPSVSNLAGDNIISGGARIVAGLASRQQNLIFTDSALLTMQYTGDATTAFVFALAGAGCGLIGALACAEYNGTVFWASNTAKFFSYAGGAPTPIPCRIERDVFTHIADQQGEKIVCGILPRYSEAWFLIPDSRDGNECSRYATYRWDEGHWTAGTLARSSWVAPGVYGVPLLFGTDGAVYEHETGNTANGGTLNAWIESAYFDAIDGEILVMVRGIVGDFQELSGYVDFTLTGRIWPTANEAAYGPFRHTPTTQKLDMRMTARQVKILLSSTASPLYWRLGALRLDIVPTGMKR